MRRVCRFAFLALVSTALSAAPAWAAPFLLGTNVTVTLFNHGLGGPDPLAQTVVAGAGLDIREGDLSPIATLAMLDGEYIDIGSNFVEFRMFGGGGQTSNPLYQFMGFDPSAFYRIAFDPLQVDVSAATAAATATVDGQVVTFSAANQWFDLNVGSLGILTSSTNLGTLRVNLSVREVGPPAPSVPEPATVVLLGAGLSLLVARRTWGAPKS